MRMLFCSFPTSEYIDNQALLDEDDNRDKKRRKKTNPKKKKQRREIRSIPHSQC